MNVRGAHSFLPRESGRDQMSNEAFTRYASLEKLAPRLLVLWPYCHDG